MKQCPICGASAFDDARVCYGCLHRFDADDQLGLGYLASQESELEEGITEVSTQKIELPIGITAIDLADDARSITIKFAKPLEIV